MERRRIRIFGHKTEKNKRKLFPPIDLVIFVSGQSDNCHPLYQLPLQGTGVLISQSRAGYNNKVSHRRNRHFGHNQCREDCF